MKVEATIYNELPTEFSLPHRPRGSPCRVPNARRIRICTYLEYPLSTILSSKYVCQYRAEYFVSVHIPERAGHLNARNVCLEWK